MTNAATQTNTARQFQELAEAAKNAQDVLITASTIFPLTLFPDTISIDRVKVNVKRRMFFRLSTTTSMQIEDILNAEVSVGPFFGTLKIWTRFFSNSDEPLVINYLSRDDAFALKRVIQGFIIARQKELDCAHIDKHELLRVLNELGGAVTAIDAT